MESLSNANMTLCHGAKKSAPSTEGFSSDDRLSHAFFFWRHLGSQQARFLYDEANVVKLMTYKITLTDCEDEEISTTRCVVTCIQLRCGS